ncbi:hypothetical protein [Hymenobacter volaticus]|uniref:Uncharacterized protein n=1 Tax=Hymenobacter volaticus TaxID=2932254 RepID=A0ABY4G952_9BACT|nr:hypothetical protein [Hymenobacter volaticus]UOQ67440.1 hypothetical protein MUN86_06050 [Hymenobacter volaticus]
MKAYSDPPPRSFAEWCHDLGISSEGGNWVSDQVMLYEEFCLLPDTKLRKIKEGPLYGFWRQYGDVFGEPRTVQEWLDDIGRVIVEPTDDDTKDLTLFLGHDEFWEWIDGKIEWNEAINKTESKGLITSLKEIFTNK